MEDKFKDLLEDEELAALRLEALKSKRRKLDITDNSSDSAPALPINSIVSIPASTSETASNQIPFVQTDRNAYNNYTWRKQIMSSRRRGGPFPKNNQRSNLIVISPVSLNDSKDSEEKVPALILPQHKWCNSGNEDSLSPKTLRRTGPTRFNRHGSDSESSDSDYENSENDSGSNETVLQDEPPEHFSRLSPDNNVAVSDNVEKQRRLSFQNLENQIQSDTFEKNETTSVYNCLKNSSSAVDYTKSKTDNFSSVQNLSDNRHDWSSSVGNEYSSYKQYNSGQYSIKPIDSSESFVEKQNSCIMSNGESHVNETNNLIVQSSDSSLWQRGAVEVVNSYYSRDIATVPENNRNHGLNDRKSKDYPDNAQSFQIGREIQGSESSIWQHGENIRMNNSYFSRDPAYIKSMPRNYNNDNVNSKEKILSGDDLRLELKKRMQEMQSKTTALENSNEIIDHKKTDQSSSWDRSKCRYTYEEDRIDDISCTNLYGSRQELTPGLLKNRQDLSFSRERDRDEHSVNLNRRRYHRSLSRERNKSDSSSCRDRNRNDYNFAPERNRYNRSSSLDRNKHEFSSNRGRSRLERSCSQSRLERSCSRGRLERSSSRSKSKLERSSSRGRNKHERSSSRERNRQNRSSSWDRRHERSSSKSKIKYESVKDLKHERSPSEDRSKHEYRSSQERGKHEHSVDRIQDHEEHDVIDGKSRHNRGRRRYEHRHSPGRKRYARSSSSQDRSRHECWSNRNHSRSDRSSSEDSRREHSSSSNSRHEYSSSQEGGRYKRNRSRGRSRRKHSQSRGRSRHRKSLSRDRNRQDRSCSKKKSSHERSQSQDSRSEHSSNQDKGRRERSSSHDRNKHENINQGGDEVSESRGRHEHNLSGNKSAYKSKLCNISSDEKSRLENTPSQENIESVQHSERIRSDRRFERNSTKEQSVVEERNRQACSGSKENKGLGRVSHSKYEDYSRSRSNSTTSCSSSSSSSSSHSSRPKIRSVPSVIKSFQPKCMNVEKKETISEVKLVGKNIISTSQSDISSTSFRKDVDYNKFSNVKCGRIDGDLKASDSNKRVPVHMRLGMLPRKRLIQMPKDVEAAFVNSSSSSDGENVNTKCKRQNIRIVTDVYGSKSGIDYEKKHLGKEKSAKKSSDIYQEISKRVKIHR